MEHAVCVVNVVSLKMKFQFVIYTHKHSYRNRGMSPLLLLRGNAGSPTLMNRSNMAQSKTFYWDNAEREQQQNLRIAPTYERQLLITKKLLLTTFWLFLIDPINTSKSRLRSNRARWSMQHALSVGSSIVIGHVSLYHKYAKLGVNLVCCTGIHCDRTMENIVQCMWFG